MFGSCFSDCLWWKKSRLETLYEKGQEKIEKELDIVKLVKNLRYMKILLRSSLMSKKMKFDIMHAQKNLIELSEEEEEEPQDKKDGQETNRDNAGGYNPDEDNAEDIETMDVN